MGGCSDYYLLLGVDIALLDIRVFVCRSPVLVRPRIPAVSVIGSKELLE